MFNRLSNSSSFLVNSFFADAARQVNAVVTTIPPRKSESGSSVESLMTPLLFDAASPTLAIPMPVEVQMNCDTDSIVIFTIRTFYLMGATDSRRAVSPVRFSQRLTMTSQYKGSISMP